MKHADINSEMSRDSKNAFLHCGDLIARASLHLRPHQAAGGAAGKKYP